MPSPYENERNEEVDKCFKYLYKAFRSEGIKDAFEACFSAELYRYAEWYAKNKAHYPSDVYTGVIATVLLYDIVNEDGCLTMKSPKERLDEYIEGGMAKVKTDILTALSDAYNRKVKFFCKRAIGNIKRKMYNNIGLK